MSVDRVMDFWDHVMMSKLMFVSRRIRVLVLVVVVVVVVVVSVMIVNCH